jgi:hypothetical protein
MIFDEKSVDFEGFKFGIGLISGDIMSQGIRTTINQQLYKIGGTVQVNNGGNLLGS